MQGPDVAVDEVDVEVEDSGVVDADDTEFHACDHWAFKSSQIFFSDKGGLRVGK